MKNLNHLNEQDEVYSEEHAKELLAIKANYNKMLQELNNKLAKQITDLSVKHLKINQAKQQLAQTQRVAAKVAGTQTPSTTQTTTGTVDKAGNPVNADGSPVTKESYSDILKVKQRLNEETYDTRYADSETVQDLKDYMDAENISYIEDEDETTLDFDKDELDPEWEDRLDDLGLEEMDDNVETDDILDYTDDEKESAEDDEDEELESDEKDITDVHDEIDEEKVFYVDINDADGDFTGKIYKLFDDGEWHAKIVDGDSGTFEQLHYDPSWDEFDVIAFLRENYDDAELIDKEEFNDHVKEPEEEVEEALRGNGNVLNIQDKVKEHRIPTFDDYINEIS
jgi:hypothetical protein